MKRQCGTNSFSKLCHSQILQDYAVCTGQGAWEEAWSTRAVDQYFQRLGIHIWVDYWGYDVNHDWPWWYKQANYFLPYLLD
jgi:esterase/lipase superfamily enzyme